MFFKISFKKNSIFQDLQETGIGRTVNSLRKYDGAVGIAAKALVMKWKSMVASAEESGSEGLSEDEPDDDTSKPKGEF